jgi:hypothetical protein
MSPALRARPYDDSREAEARVVRLERWAARAFHVVPCPFEVDRPLDLGGCIAKALHETRTSGRKRIAAGLIMASDRTSPQEPRRTRRSGAIFVEVDPRGLDDDPSIAWLDGDVLVRALPPRAAALRPEVDELLRWSIELGHEVDGFYVAFAAGEAPRSFRPVRLLAALDAPVVETFEVRGTRRSITSFAY